MNDDLTPSVIQSTDKQTNQVLSESPNMPLHFVGVSPETGNSPERTPFMFKINESPSLINEDSYLSTKGENEPGQESVNVSM